jgi:hypothetical protein
MEIREEDFPLYQLLVKYESDNPGVQTAMKDFNAAVHGGDEEKYNFAMGIQTVAVNVPVGEIRGSTQEVYDKTLRSAFAVFSDVASHGHEGAAFMVQYYKDLGIGQPEQKPPAPKSKNFDL